MAKKNETQWWDLHEIEDRLANAGWRDDTLSPLTQRYYWRLAMDLVPNGEEVRSILFAKSVPTRIMQKQYVFVATDQHILWRSSSAGVISNPKIMDYHDLYRLDVAEDLFLPGSLFIDFTIRKEFWFLNYKRKLTYQTFDPTATRHFVRTVMEHKGMDPTQIQNEIKDVERKN